MKTCLKWTKTKTSSKTVYKSTKGGFQIEARSDEDGWILWDEEGDRVNIVRGFYVKIFKTLTGAKQVANIIWREL